MAWPSSTKASTTNIDAGSDKPSLARADIKQNIDNVNSIIDTFDIAAPTNNDYLKYNSTTSKWEPGALSTSNAGTVAILVSDSNNINGGASGTFTLPITELADPGNMISISSNQFALAAGNYLIEIVGGQLQTAPSPTAGFVNFDFYNVTDSVIVQNTNSPADDAEFVIIENVNNTGEDRAHFVTLTGTDTYRFQFTIGSAINVNSFNLILRITKF